MKRLWNSVAYWLLIVALSLRWIFRINLGNRVRYRGMVYTVSNGVRVCSWRLGGLDNGDDGWVPRDECRLLLTPANLLHSFTSGYRFYMGYWYAIWVRNGIEPWMRSCQIW